MASTQASTPLQRIALLRPGEGRVLLWAIAYFFFLLLSLYLLRPVREAMGIARGADSLPWLMSATMAVMLLANPLYTALVSRWPRRRFVPGITHFFAALLLGFAALFTWLPGHGGITLGYVFYVWLSVFNLFVVSVFWSLMADLFNEDQGKRLFGLISIGGTLGAIVGAAVTEQLSRGGLGIQVPPAGLMLLAVLTLEGAVFCMQRLGGIFRLSQPREGSAEPGPDFKAGFLAIGRSRYLQAIALYILLYTVCSTLLYLMQGSIVAKSFASAAERTAAFARIDLGVNLLTLVLQLLVTSRLLRGIGVAGVLLVLPLLTLVGMGGLALWPSFAVLAIVQVLRRGVHYAVDRPARETLYIPLGPEEKYKAKPFIDTFVYRFGDVLGVWAPSLVALLAVPVSALAIGAAAVWALLARYLGDLAKRQQQRPDPESPLMNLSEQERSAT